MGIYTKEIPSYVYKHLNTITGQFYFGSRCRNIKLNLTPEEDFPKYVCSANIKTQILEEKEIWISKIIKTFYGKNKRIDSWWYEQDLIKEHWKDPLILNKHYFDREKGHSIFLPKEFESEETRRKKSISALGNTNGWGKGKPAWNKGKCGQIPWNKGKTGIYSQETLENMSKNGGHAKGKLWYNDGEKEYHILPEDVSPNFIEGRIFKKREMEIKICPYCGLSGSGGNMSRYHFDNCKQKGENQNSLPV